MGLGRRGKVVCLVSESRLWTGSSPGVLFPPQSHRTHVVASFEVGQSRFCAGLLTDTGSRSGTLPCRVDSAALGRAAKVVLAGRGEKPRQSTYHCIVYLLSSAYLWQLRVSTNNDECRIIWFSEQVFPRNCLEQKCPKLIFPCERVGIISQRWVIACANIFTSMHRPNLPVVQKQCITNSGHTFKLIF